MGVAYLLSPEAFAKMDRNEGPGYRRVEVTVESVHGPLQAIAYIANENAVCAEAIPSAIYLDTILSGLDEHAIDNNYIASVERLGRGVKE